MPKWIQPRIFILCLLAFCAAPRAQCSLHSLAGPVAAAPERLEFGVHFQQVSFDREQETGDYWETVPSVKYSPLPFLSLGFQWPLLYLRTTHSWYLGQGNPSLLAELRRSLGGAGALTWGVQADFPLGDDREGLAMPGYMGVTYGTWSRRGESFFSGLTLGASAMLPWKTGSPASADGAASMPNMDMTGPSMGAMKPMLIHPHENFEAMYRLSLGTQSLGRRLAPTLTLSGEEVLGPAMNPGAGRHFVSGEFELPILLHQDRAAAAPAFMLPLYGPHRFEWSAGLSLRLGINAPGWGD